MNLSIAPFLPAVLLCAAPLTAQALLQRIDGVNAAEAVGRCVAPAGDVNADGYADFLVGADWVDAPAQDTGEVYVYDGRSLANGSLVRLWTFRGDSIGDFFGWSCACAGDVDGDGHDDIVVGAYGDDPALTLDAGSAYVYSGRTGQLLYHFAGTSQQGVGTEDRFGWAVAGAGDVNGDGYADVIVGAHTVDIGAFGDAGTATVFSGRDGSMLFRYEGTAALQFAGFSVSGAGDVDGDGWDEVMVGVAGDSSVGQFGGTALLLTYDPLQTTGYSIVRRYDGLAPGDLQGVSLANAGDVDGDFVPDQIVGAVFGDPNGNIDRGAARVYSGATGALIYAFGGFYANSLLGFSVAGAGDVDGDGHADLIVGAALDSTVAPVVGSAFVYSGATGQIIATFGGSQAADAFGWHVSSAGDIDDDGYAELLVGAPFADPNGLSLAGSVYVYDDVRSVATPAKMQELGAACPHSNGHLPTLTYDGRISIGGTLQLGLRGSLPATSVVLNVAARFNPPVPLGAIGFQTSCTAYVKPDGFIAYSATNSAGVAAKSAILVPNDPSFIGAVIHAQWICFDAGVTGSWVFSDALKMTIGN